MFTNALVAFLGVLLMLGAFFARGMRAAFSRDGPMRPISVTGRVILFVGGLLVFLNGLRSLWK